MKIQIGYHKGIGKMYRSKKFSYSQKNKLKNKRPQTKKIDKEKYITKKRTIRYSLIISSSEKAFKESVYDNHIV